MTPAPQKPSVQSDATPTTPEPPTHLPSKLAAEFAPPQPIEGIEEPDSQAAKQPTQDIKGDAIQVTDQPTPDVPRLEDEPEPTTDQEGSTQEMIYLEPPSESDKLAQEEQSDRSRALERLMGGMRPAVDQDEELDDAGSPSPDPDDNGEHSEHPQPTEPTDQSKEASDRDEDDPRLN